jgi:hypothetical protein
VNTDVKTLLERAADAGPPIDPLVDVTADLRRAHRHVQRRRSARLSAVGATLLVAGLVPAVLLHDTTDAGAPVAVPAVLTLPDLVAYHDDQGKAFHLDWVPAGWTIVADDTTSIILAPKRGANPNPQMMDAKIQVGALSDDVDIDGVRSVPGPDTDAKSLTDGIKKVSINGQEGYLDLQSLTYQARTGRWIRIDLPDRLGLGRWPRAQFIKFAEGITVGKNLGHAGG